VFLIVMSKYLYVAGEFFVDFLSDAGDSNVPCVI